MFTGTFFNSNYIDGVEIIDNKIDGRGTVVKFNGDIYRGIFEKGVFISGKVEFKDYIGEMENNKKQGKGILFLKNEVNN